MARIVKAGSQNPVDLTVYFNVMLRDLSGPALNEQNGQPQVNINGKGWQFSYISPLISLGYGQYKATLDPFIFLNAGDVIETLYQGTITAAALGDTFNVVDAITGLPAQSPLFNTYGTVQGGDIYFSQRLRNDAWIAANPQQKIAALVEATRLIDRLNFEGNKADPNQILQFPRSYTTPMLVNNVLTSITTIDPNGIPQDIIFAAYEVAIKLLDGYDPDLEIDNLFATSKGYSSVRASYDTNRIPEYIRNGIPSAVAWSYLIPYLRDAREIRVTRV